MIDIVLRAMPSRLVILGSSITALAVARDAHSHGFEPMVVDTHDGIAFRSRWTTPLRIEADQPEGVAAIERMGGLDSWLVATSDPWVRFVTQHRTRLDASYRAVLHPSNGVLEICLHKQRFACWCADNGLSAPRAWVPGIDTRPAGLAPPFLIRPAETLHGQPSRGLPKAVEVHDEAQLNECLRRFADAHCAALVSESLLGRSLTQYSVPFARANGETMSFVARKVRPLPERCAVGTCVELWPEPQVEALARAAVEKLDWFGIGEVEILHSHRMKRNFLIEINARPWLQYALAPASGHDFLGLCTGHRASYQSPVRTGRRWIDLQSDLFAAFSSSEGMVRQGHLGLGSYLRSLTKANVFARFDFRDPFPAFYRPRGT